MTFTRIELDYLATQTLGRLATVQRNGTLQVSPVGFHYNPDTATIDISGYNMTAAVSFTMSQTTVGSRSSWTTSHP